MDRRIAQAIEAAPPILRREKGGDSFREAYLEDALLETLRLEEGVVATATGKGRVVVPHWDKKLGGFDLTVDVNRGRARALVEAKIYDVDQTLWDLYKLIAATSEDPETSAYLVVATSEKKWSGGECSALFRPYQQEWASRDLFVDWAAAWANLLDGGSARPTSVPSRVRTTLIARAPTDAYPRWADEVRCIRVEAVDAEDRIPFDGDWPAGRSV